MRKILVVMAIVSAISSFSNVRANYRREKMEQDLRDKFYAEAEYLSETRDDVTFNPETGIITFTY